MAPDTFSTAAVPISIVVEPEPAAVATGHRSLLTNTKLLEELLASGQISKSSYDKLSVLELEALQKALASITSAPASLGQQPTAPTEHNVPLLKGDYERFKAVEHKTNRYDEATLGTLSSLGTANSLTSTSTLLNETQSNDNIVDDVPDQTNSARNSTNPALDKDWWDRDDPAELVSQTTKLRKRSSQGLFGSRFRFVKRLPLLLQTLFFIVSGGALIMIPGSISIVFFVHDRGIYWIQQTPTAMGVGGYTFFVFAVYLLIVWAFFWACRYLLIVLPELIIRVSDFMIGTADDGSTNYMVEHVVDYLRHIRRAVVYLLTSVVGLSAFAGIFGPINYSNQYNWQQVVTLLWTCFLYACFVWVCEKLALQVFAVHFSRRAFSERLAEEKFAYHVLGCLNRARYRPHNSIGISFPMSKSDVSTDSHHGSEFDTELVVNELEKMQEKISTNSQEHWLKGSGFTNLQSGVHESTRKIGFYAKNVGGLLVGYDATGSNGVVLRSLADAKSLARRLFIALQRGSTGVLYPADFRPYFSNKDEATLAFKLFDKNENGDISPQELRSTIIRIYRDKLALDKSLRDGNQAMHKLDGMLKVFMVILIIFICLAFFGINVSQFLAGLISLWLGILFAVGGTVKNLLEAIIFLFVTHPYDVGDVVEIDGATYIVKEFALTSTVFRTGDGKEVIAPNPTLNTKFIYNIRRSGPMTETITLKLSQETTEEQLNTLKERLNSFLNTQTRDFNSGLMPIIAELNGDAEMVISLSLSHKMNWTQGNKAARSNKFMIELRKILKEIDIKMSKSMLNVKLDGETVRDAIVGTRRQGEHIGHIFPEYKDE